MSKFSKKEIEQIVSCVFELVPLQGFEVDDLVKLAFTESSFESLARNDTSTATGLFQITKPAFEEVKKKYVFKPEPKFWPEDYDGAGTPAHPTGTLFDIRINTVFALLYLKICGDALRNKGLLATKLNVLNAYHYGFIKSEWGDYGEKVLSTDLNE